MVYLYFFVGHRIPEKIFEVIILVWAKSNPIKPTGLIDRFDYAPTEKINS